MTIQASIELKDLKLRTKIGTYQPGDSVPDNHLLNLSLWIDASLVLIGQDGMEYVFDYDPLILEIDRLAGDCHYETQERLISRIAQACSIYSEIIALEIGLCKSPVHNGSGSLGVKLHLDEAALNQLRALSE
ncbi:MAG: dihydroneopterin aldolase [Polynucleobacter sp.]